MAVQRILAIETDTFKSTVHLEVDNTRNSVRTVGRRGATGQNFNALYQSRRNEVKIGCCTATDTAWHQTTTVDQNESTTGTKSAKRNRCSTIGTIRYARVLSSDNLRQVVDQVFDLG